METGKIHAKFCATGSSGLGTAVQNISGYPQFCDFLGNFRPNLYDISCILLFFSLLWITDELLYLQADLGGKTTCF